jgi:hypothetical protein
MRSDGRLTSEARKQMLITLIAGGIFIFALAFYTTSQGMSESPPTQPPPTSP